MDNPLVISLVVSGIGMLMLFLALALLYGLMYLMTALLKDRPEASAGEQEAGEGRQEARSRRQEAGSRKWRVAVIGVAMARAELEMGGIGAPGAGELGGPGRASAWRALHHQRQLTLNVRSRRAR